jgi:aminomuconate-semialdehyde/2-hydroxymuconate-6-semialdehyde dehydrogenase
MIASELFKISNFIGGKYVEPVGQKYLDNYDPSVGQVYSLVPDSDERDVEAAVAAAQAAFPVWSKKTAAQRSHILNQVANILERRLDEFAAAESRDQGKPVKLAKTVDIPRAISNFRFFAGCILYHEERSTDTDGKAINYTIRQPLGVGGLISPWNLPLYLLTWKIAPCIAVGNTCVCKPSELTPMTAYMLGEVLNEAGVPPGTVNLVFGLGSKAGNALVSHPKVPLISFTGGTQTGEIINKTSASHCKKLSLELGGKNPNIIFDDAKLDECVDVSVRSSFTNQGEVCLCGSRIFVQKGIYKDFLEKFVEKTKALKVGPPKDDGTNLGALVSKEHLQKVDYYVSVAREEKGTILTGGARVAVPGHEGGYYYPPTIITDVGYTATCARDEIFGPVVTVTPFESEEEVIMMANSVQYGLSASVWTESQRRAHRVAAALHVGMVWVNTWMLRDLRVPFGGSKKSGIGREGGEFSIDFYTEAKNICFKYADD